MAFIPTPSGISLCFHFTTAGQEWQFCLQLKKSAGSVTPTDLATVTSDASDWWTAPFKARLSDDTTLRNITATDQSVQGGSQDIATINEVGGTAGSAAPLNAAICISQRTAKRGRSYRGRAYHGGYNIAQLQDAVTFSSSYASDLVDDFEALQAALDASGLRDSGSSVRSLARQ